MKFTDKKIINALIRKTHYNHFFAFNLLFSASLLRKHFFTKWRTFELACNVSVPRHRYSVSLLYPFSPPRSKTKRFHTNQTPAAIKGRCRRSQYFVLVLFCFT